MTPLRARAMLVAATVVLAGCGTGAAPEAQPTETSPPTSATPSAQSSATTAPEQTSSEPAIDGWSTEADAIASLEAFVTELESADRFHLTRRDTLGFGEDYFHTVIDYVVDLTGQRIGAVQTMEASSDEVAEQLVGEPGVVLDDLETHSVLDYTSGSLRVLMTFPAKWDGRWLEITSDAAAAEDPTLGALYAESDPASLAAPFLEVAALQSATFAPSSDTLTIPVPVDVAIGWIPNQTALNLAQLGVDLESAPFADAVGYATPVAGGIEIVVDLTPMFESIPEVAESLGGFHTLVALGVADLGTTDEVVMPPASAISTEPWE